MSRNRTFMHNRHASLETVALEAVSNIPSLAFRIAEYHGFLKLQFRNLGGGLQKLIMK